MGLCQSRRAPVVGLDFSGPRPLTKEQDSMVATYLPDFHLREQSTSVHLQIAAAHWNAVFKEVRGSVKSSHLYSTTEASQHRDSCGEHEKSTNTQTGSKIGLLFDAFYIYLDEHSPELKPMFRSSLRVKGKVLVHISAGMRSLLTGDNATERIIALTKTHLQFGVQLTHFNPLGKALLHAMAQVSEDLWTPEVSDAARC